MLLSAPYQGNEWWSLLALGSLAMLFYVVLRVRKRRRVGLPVDIRETILGCVFLLGFLVTAVFQVLTHQ